MAVVFNQVTGLWEQDNDPTTTLGAEYTPTGLTGTSGGGGSGATTNWGDASKAAASAMQAMMAAAARKKELELQRMMEENQRMEHVGDQMAGTTLRGGANAYDKHHGEADAISTILSRVLR